MPAASLKLDESELELVSEISAFEHDPYGFVMFAFPWGLPNTDLARHKGPRKWQVRFLKRIGLRLRANALTSQEVIQEAVSTGHGVGKSALVAMLILWALSTREDTRIVVTANTEGQLTGKTWPELAKWYRMAINSHWFKLENTSLHAVDQRHRKTWRCDLVPWSETNTEAFAGLHNEGKRIVLVFDEASAIINQIWEVAEGALTDADTEILWVVFGNPTRNEGRFFDCFHRLRHRWGCEQLDSREVEGTNKEQIQKWVEDEGEDSDFVRVRVRGVFPRTSTLQFIDREAVDLAMKRDAQPGSPRHVAIVGVDVARFGPCNSVIATRLGRDARQFPLIQRRGMDGMKLAGRVSEHIKHLRSLGLRVVVFVDAGGVGGPVVDRLHQLGYEDCVIGVNFGGAADDPRKYFNKRAEMYGRFKEWLDAGLLPKSEDLANQLGAIEYTFTATDQIQLERKERMILDGRVSPDDADAIALTFAFAVPGLDPAKTPEVNSGSEQRRAYNPQDRMLRRVHN